MKGSIHEKESTCSNFDFDIMTPYWGSVFFAFFAQGATMIQENVGEKYTKLIAEGQFPIARWGTPEDVASVVSLVCDDRYVYTTGNYIDVDGGFHIRRL